MPVQIKQKIPYPELKRDLLVTLWELMDYMEDILNLNKQTLDYLDI